MNERDSDAVMCNLLENGHEITENEDSADVILLNTCSVREKAEQKAIGKASRILNSSSAKKPTVGIIGCMAQNEENLFLRNYLVWDLSLGLKNFIRFRIY